MGLKHKLLKHFDNNQLVNSTLIVTDNDEKSLEEIKLFAKEVFYRSNPNIEKTENDEITSPNLYLVQKNSDAKYITVNLVRDMQQFMLTKNAVDEFRICLIYQADLLNDNAANCILKVLEEPKTNNILILLTTKAYTLLPTIRSRCQTISSFYKDKTSSNMLEEELELWQKDKTSFLKFLNSKIDKDKFKMLILNYLEFLRTQMTLENGNVDINQQILTKYTRVKKIADNMENYDLDLRSSAILLFEELKE